MNGLSDEILIRGIRNREDTVFQYLQVKFQDGIRLMVLEMGGNREDARDVFNEGLVALMRLVDREDFSLTCKLGTLVYALCKNIWKQQLQEKAGARKYQLRSNDPGPEPDFTEDADIKLYREIFWESFKKLDEKCRKILEAYLREVPPGVIARSLRCSESYVRKRKSLCHGYLMELIANHPDFMKIKMSDTKIAHEIPA
jgi:RNA polymerase sigma factor (sigma-70 family)